MVFFEVRQRPSGQVGRQLPPGDNRKNYLFAGFRQGGRADRGGLHPVLGTCHMNDANPLAYLSDPTARCVARDDHGGPLARPAFVPILEHGVAGTLERLAPYRPIDLTDVAIEKLQDGWAHLRLDEILPRRWKHGFTRQRRTVPVEPTTAPVPHCHRSVGRVLPEGGPFG
jgi:hypothetical protein